MKILQLCKKFPYPLKDGESIAVTYLAKALDQLGCDISLLAMNTTKHPVVVNRIRPKLQHYKSVHYTTLNNEVKPLHAFLNLFSSDSYNISRFEDEAFGKKLMQLLKKEKYDLVQLESLYLAPYIRLIRKHSKAKIFLRAHNVEHEIWERMAENEDNTVRSWYFDYSARKLKKYEIEQLKHIDSLVPISAVDHEKFRKFGYQGPSQPLPIGLDMSDFPFQEVATTDKLALSFIGSLDWMPNIEALNWFVDRIWPQLNLIFPKLSLHVAGRNCPDWIHNLEIENMTVHGEVPDSKVFLQRYPISVVPILSGSGMRAKIIEAMALGRIVISTQLGLEGIQVKDKTHVLIANNEEEFIRKIRFCYHHKKHLPILSRNARNLVEAEFDHLEIAQRLIHTFESIAIM
ncbi:MAG: glycosyltransferase family 4 protein [Saprospiraceae bacterium]|nr:glycosyltransferase family 4 protein [Saprospiraceae bacterium]